MLCYGADNQLGSTDTIYLNGGGISFVANGTSAMKLSLGPAGGTLYDGAYGTVSQTYSGAITGSGALTISSNNCTLKNSGNTYSGGTLVSGRVGAICTGSLGTGQVNITNYLTLGDNDNSGNTVSFPQRLGLYGASLGSSTLYIDEQTAALGSIEGNGNLVLDANNNAFSTTLTIGSDNTSSEFDGTILNYSSSTGVNGNIVKTGMGTLNLAGYNIYTGTTTINQGESRYQWHARLHRPHVRHEHGDGQRHWCPRRHRHGQSRRHGEQRRQHRPRRAGTVGGADPGRRPDPQ